ncbi:MAG: GGDEF domain-containing protein, partial [Anaerolineales bacterium]|nr:GGDEF domain-containing protein [Anaerolineales bacterium]
ERCRSNSRSVDVVCRYGGEEFVVFLPETNLEAARIIAERLRQNVMDAPFSTDAGPLRITISVGVAQANEYETLKSLIERADQALYAAKHGGRNCVMVSGGIQPISQT